MADELSSTPTRCRAAASCAGCWRRWASPTAPRSWTSHDLKGPDYLAINPMGKVPAIRHGDTVVTEGAAICAYLADAFPQAGPRPAARRQRARPYYRWLFFAAGPIEAAVTNKALGFVMPGGRERMVGYGSYRRGDERAGGRGLAGRLSGRRRLHRRRCLCRLADRLRHAVRHHREAAGVRALLGSASARGRPPCAPEIDDGLIAPKR